MPSKWTYVFALLLPLITPSLPIRRLVAEYEHSGPFNLSHLAVDEERGRLFLAGANVLYQMDDLLRLRHKVETGPVLDSHFCGASGCGTGNSGNSSPTNNYNKVLAIDRRDNQLIVCGSVKQGSCSKYSLSDISNTP